MKNKKILNSLSFSYIITLVIFYLIYVSNESEFVECWDQTTFKNINKARSDKEEEE